MSERLRNGIHIIFVTGKDYLQSPCISNKFLIIIYLIELPFIPYFEVQHMTVPALCIMTQLLCYP